jgi:hypothetical protein
MTQPSDEHPLWVDAIGSLIIIVLLIVALIYGG